IYEKALPFNTDWQGRLEMASSAGFDVVEISVDESDHRQARLRWSAAQRAGFRYAISATGVKVITLCLSGHRKYPDGSADPKIRETAHDLMLRAIDFAVDTGIRTIQLAGYYVYYEPHLEDSRKRYRDGLAMALEEASKAGVMLALENVDGDDVMSVSRAMEFVEEFNSPWFQVYPDVGNLAEHGLDVVAEIKRGQNHYVGLHVKDTRPGEPRRVPFGEGITPFIKAFSALNEIGYGGPVMLEMWNDDSPDSLEIIRNARTWVVDKMIKGGLVGEAMRKE
ncbi:MAG: L-ribulose-5-phosphate 3-epimerase, partial [Chloroflexota bacterium]